MKTYKPEYLGKVIPADDTTKLTDFVTNKYDSFAKIYEVCKDSSKEIKDIQVVDSSNGSLSVKVSTNKETLTNISEKVKKDSSITVNGDVITAK